MSKQDLHNYENDSVGEFKELWSAVGKAVRELRKRHRLSQEELCVAAGLNRTYVSDIERGERNVSISVLFKISTAFKIPLTELIQLAEQIYKKATNSEAIEQSDYAGYSAPSSMAMQQR